jgi:hypothetical protein
MEVIKERTCQSVVMQDVFIDSPCKPLKYHTCCMLYKCLQVDLKLATLLDSDVCDNGNICLLVVGANGSIWSAVVAR